mgnify:CR=1 FL=1
MSSLFKDKIILVTGGTGSIGSEIVKQLLLQNPKSVRIFSRDEHKQFIMRQEIGDPDEVRYFLGDVRDQSRLHRAMKDVDYVFHCAAYKHVPLCEYNSFEAVKTNVLGTQNVIEAALQQNVKRVLFISTDKAASPSNVMGATKLLAERLMTSAMLSRGMNPIIFGTVRFGNVLGSRGSMLPIFCNQIKNGDPVTITNPEMTRFIMSIPEAVNLTFTAMEKMQGGELFILKMPVVKLQDLIDTLIKEIAPLYKKDPASVNCKTIGIRPGEKMDEILMTNEEAQYATEDEKMFIVRSSILPFTEGDIPESQQEYEAYNSSNLPTMNNEEIQGVLKDFLEKSTMTTYETE